MATSDNPDPSRPEFMRLLGLGPPYAVADVKQAYRTRALRLHPDAGGDASQFRQLQEAYERALAYAEFRASRMTWLAAQIERYAQQESLIAELRAQGIHVETESIDWMNRSFGADFAQVTERIVGIHMAGSATFENAIGLLVQEQSLLGSLRTLNLDHTRVGDAGIWCLQVFPNLRRLHLAGTRVTAQGLKTLRALPALEWVDLRGAGVGTWRRPFLRWFYRRLQVAI